jgi:hypothetical protein
MENNIHVLQENIYITSDEKLPYNSTIFHTGAFYHRDFGGDVHIINKDTHYPNPNFCSRIILTTDKSLFKYGVQAIDDEFLEWFVKNLSCERVEVEEEDYSQKCRECGETVKRGYNCTKGCFMKSGNFIPTDKNINYKIIIPKEEQECMITKIMQMDAKMAYDSLPKQRLEKYSERFDNKDNELVEGVFNPDTWGKRMVEEQETLEEVAENFWLNDNTMTDNDRISYVNGFTEGYKLAQERSYSEEDMIKFMQFIVSEEELENTSGVSIDTAKYFLNKFKNK